MLSFHQGKGGFHSLWTVACTEQHCTALKFTALHCTALNLSALYSTELHNTALHCTALKCFSDPDIDIASPLWNRGRGGQGTKAAESREENGHF